MTLSRRASVDHYIRERLRVIDLDSVFVRLDGRVSLDTLRAIVDGGEIPEPLRRPIVAASWPGMRLAPDETIRPIPVAVEAARAPVRAFPRDRPLDRWHGLFREAARCDDVAGVLARRDRTDPRTARLRGLADQLRAASNSMRVEIAEPAEQALAVTLDDLDLDALEHTLATEEAARLRLTPPASAVDYHRIFKAANARH